MTTHHFNNQFDKQSILDDSQDSLPSSSDTSIDLIRIASLTFPWQLIK